VHDQVFNVGQTAENYRISELAEIVTQVVPGSRVEYAPGGGPDKRCYRVSCEKIKRTLPDFKPQWTARTGAEELYTAYRETGLSKTDLEQGRYIRIRCIQKRLAAGDLDSCLHWTRQPAEMPMSV